MSWAQGPLGHTSLFFPALQNLRIPAIAHENKLGADSFSTDVYMLSTSMSFLLLRNTNRRTVGMFSWSDFPSVCITSATLRLLGKAAEMWTNPRRTRWLH